ncbi:hypothetical protein DBR43_15580 [Pedobacter sp. KBW06]|nr:hypothetical protein DBR43_15580 [Pedobacter sp. KBW06]
MSFPGTYIRLKIPLNTTIRYSKPAILAVLLFGFIIWSGLEYLTIAAGNCYGNRSVFFELRDCKPIVHGCGVFFKITTYRSVFLLSLSQTIDPLQRDSTITHALILEKVAPIFNKKGYSGTTLSDLTEASGLTKGALYFHFRNKQDLAIQAFRINVKRMINPLTVKMQECNTALEKLQTMISYYRGYYELVEKEGGCPVLNMGTDANNNNPELFEAVKALIIKLETGIIELLMSGIAEGGIKQDIDAVAFGKNIYCMIEGGVFMAVTHKDGSYLTNMMDLIESLLREKMSS